MIAQLRLRTHERQWMLTRFLDVIHKQQGEFKLNERWFRTGEVLAVSTDVWVSVWVSVARSHSASCASPRLSAQWAS